MRTLDSGSFALPSLKSGWEPTVDATLRRLGVPLEPSVRDLDTAIAQGFAAASVVLDHRAPESGNPDEAIAAFDGTTLPPQDRRHVNLGHFLAVAHYLRGTAYEAKGLAVQALGDYAMALVPDPDHDGALAARDRLHAERRGT